MQLVEIVGAVINSRQLLTDRKQIDASVAKGVDVQLIARSRARWLAVETPAERWMRLVNAPTLFVLDKGIRYASVDVNRNA